MTAASFANHVITILVSVCMTFVIAWLVWKFVITRRLR